jgi:hypothetical protein
MVSLWVYKVRNEVNGTTINDVPERYYQQVLDILVVEGLYDEEGNKL